MIIASELQKGDILKTPKGALWQVLSTEPLALQRYDVDYYWEWHPTPNQFNRANMRKWRANNE